MPAAGLWARLQTSSLAGVKREKAKETDVTSTGNFFPNEKRNGEIELEGFGHVHLKGAGGGVSGEIDFSPFLSRREEGGGESEGGKGRAFPEEEGTNGKRKRGRERKANRREGERKFRQKMAEQDRDRFHPIREYLCQWHHENLKMCTQPAPSDREERMYRRERSLGLVGLQWDQPKSMLTNLVRPSVFQVCSAAEASGREERGREVAAFWVWGSGLRIEVLWCRFCAGGVA